MGHRRSRGWPVGRCRQGHTSLQRQGVAPRTAHEDIASAGHGRRCRDANIRAVKVCEGWRQAYSAATPSPTTRCTDTGRKQEGAQMTDTALHIVRVLAVTADPGPLPGGPGRRSTDSWVLPRADPLAESQHQAQRIGAAGR